MSYIQDVFHNFKNLQPPWEYELNLMEKYSTIQV